MSIRPVSTSMAPQAVGPYSQAIESGGLLYCSGQIPLPPEGGSLVAGGIREQTEQVLRNLSNLLQAGGSDLTHVLKTTVYLTDLANFKDMNEVYARVFNNHKPARATIQAAALPMGALVEIEAIASIIRPV
ncbi:MAG: RutC family protein [Candidatus Hinthialibacteria bacterium]|nr:MAG: Enamine/imine deaminase [Candidatus Hinthialibacteria bacterium OLB16]MBK7494328.1 RidA family protein [Candidatus Omnitrophota bacterium]MBV6481171.1 2-iminobutanoate/2-iminopropanoate deaminase [bacterium]MCE7907955.1 RidA family protein [Candidatus Omnitrophica bacterium COP1]